jgi:hypothetical protein
MNLIGKIELIVSLFKLKDYLKKDEESNINSHNDHNKVDWKKNMKLGIQIKANWCNISQNKKNLIPNFYEDCMQTREEIYNSLKGNFFKI